MLGKIRSFSAFEKKMITEAELYAARDIETTCMWSTFQKRAVMLEKAAYANTVKYVAHIFVNSKVGPP